MKDTSGGVLPGVQVEASSPVLIEQVRSVVTDGEGVYRIIDLRPGTYKVTFTLSDFATVVREGIELPAGFTASVNAEMKLGSLEEKVTVTAAAPVVDVHTTSQSQQVIPSAIRDAIPLSSNAAAFVVMIPAATQSAADRDVGGIRGEQSQGFSIHGSRTADIMILRDGLDYNQYFAGGNRSSSTNAAAVVETTVQTAGSAQSESGGVQINAIPREGGNALHGIVQGNFGHKNLQSSNIDDALRARGATAGADIKTLYEMSAGVGGPIRENRLWFFGSARRWITTSQLAGVYFNSLQSAQGTLFYEPDRSRPSFENNFYIEQALRLTWQASAKHKLGIMYSNEDNCQCHVGQRPGTLAPEAAGDNHFSPSRRGQIKWTFPASNRLLFDAGLSALWGDVVRRSTGGTDADYVITDLDRNITYGHHARDYANPPSTGGVIPYAVVSQSANVSHVTGSRTLNAGIQLRQAFQQREHFITHSMQYAFRGATPVQLTQWISPFRSETRQRAVGLYVQQQWTKNRLTVNGGLRYDHFRGYIPAMTLEPGRFLPSGASFPAVESALNYKDLNPRLGASFDLFGNGKTAVKASLGRYIGIITSQDPILRNQAPVLQMVTNATRTWNDTNRNYVPDCDFTNLNGNGECGPISNRNFGTSVAGTQYADEVTRGFGNRPYNWQGSVGATHELYPGLGIEVAYFRTSYGNFQVTDNLLVTPADYDAYRITAPSDPRLPGGGGQVVDGLYDLNPAKFGMAQNVVKPAEQFGEQIETYNGVEVNVRGRLPRGLVLTGGVSVGRTVTDNCDVTVDSPQKLFCRVAPPWGAGTQFRFAWIVPLPGDVRLSGTYQNIAGIATTSSYVYGNAQAAATLGRNLSGGGNPTRTVDLIEPSSHYPEGRSTQIDFRVSRRFRAMGLQLEPQFNVYNLTNANDVLSQTTRYGAAWLNATGVLPPRMVKLGVQIDF